MADDSTDSTKELVFPQGIPGFGDQRRYRLSHSDTESGRVYWMQSSEDPEISFTLVDPAMYSLNYQLELSDEEAALIQADGPEDVMVFLMVWKAEADDPQQQPGINANITGPILINPEKRLGMQKLISQPKVALNISA
ncbi:flagellar assembly protein FliW [Imhoffiella purpurea]|nr:flagellar assembly protein FliW [Imhoffiella purpurea]